MNRSEDVVQYHSQEVFVRQGRATRPVHFVLSYQTHPRVDLHRLTVEKAVVLGLPSCHNRCVLVHVPQDVDSQVLG